MIQFTPLASSSAGCSYLVRAEGHAPLLIDAGLSFTELQKRLWQHDVDVSDLAGCLISHGHQDHCRAAAKLMEAGVDCYASREAWQRMGATGHRQQIAVAGKWDIIPGTTWVVSSFEAEHDDPGTLGFSVSLMGHHRLVYLTDSAYSRYRFADIEIFALEANFSSDIIKENVMAGRLDVEVAKRTIQTHSSIDTVIDMLKANDLSKCKEIHLLHLSDGNSDAQDFKRQVQAATGIATYVAAR